MRYAILIAVIACGGIDESKADSAKPVNSLPVAPVASPPPPPPAAPPAVPAFTVADCVPLCPRAIARTTFVEGSPPLTFCLCTCAPPNNVQVEGALDTPARQADLLATWNQACP